MRRACATALVLSGCMLPAPAGAVPCDFTVGARGAYRTIQAALDAAAAVPGEHGICVRDGVRREHFHAAGLAPGDAARISGGWNATFDAQTGTTVLDAGGSGPAVELAFGHGEITLSHFVVTTRGRRPADAGEAVRVRLVDDARVFVEDDEFRSIALRQPADGFGGGPLTVLASDTSAAFVRRNRFHDNTTSNAAGGPGSHAGAYMNGNGDARLELSDNVFEVNDATAIVDVQTYDSARAVVADNRLSRNQVRPIGDVDPAVLLLWSIAPASGSAQVAAARNVLVGNVDPAASGHEQVFVFASGGGSVRLADTVVVGGVGVGGVFAGSDLPSARSVFATNLTIADNGGPGFVASGATGIHLSNSIVSGNADDLRGAPIETSDIVGTPVGLRFVDRAAGDYRLEFGSEGVDGGSDDPPGGLSATDVEGAPRVACRAPDVGAYETPCGAAVCRALDWPFDVPFVSREAPACRCLADAGLRELRCGALLPDVFLAVRWPMFVPPGDGVPTRWTIEPWGGAAGSYAMTMDARLGDGWVPQELVGSSAARTSDTPATESFRLKLPGTVPTPVRATLAYVKRGENTPRSVAIEVLMPEATPPSSSNP